jgi:CO/xanthine dehydrogenase Mo-binding subunit
VGRAQQHPGAVPRPAHARPHLRHRRERLRVYSARVGGGFGGKQEVFTEDLALLATMATGRPVRVEFSRKEVLTATSVRHPFRIRVRMGATADGRITGIGVDVRSNTGAYGNHGPGVMFHGVGESIAVYRAARRRSTPTSSTRTPCPPARSAATA